MPPRQRKTYDAKHRAPDEPGDYVNSRGEARRRPSPRHGEPGMPAKPPKKRSGPAATPAPTPRPIASAREGRGPSRTAVAHAAARDYQQRQAVRAAAGGKPSVVGGTVAGGVGGAAAGAMVAGPPGAAVGGVVGAAGGGLGAARAKKAYRAAMRTNGAARRVIIAEFAVCIVIAALSPLTDRKRSEPPGAFMKRMTAIMGLFLILALVSAMGRTAARISAGLGGLITVTLAVSERDLFVTLARLLRSTGDRPAEGTGPSDEGSAAGEAAGQVLGQNPGVG